MAVDTDGTFQMRGDQGAGIAVRIRASEGWLKITSGEEVLGNWDVENIGLHAIPDGFSVRAEGEEFVLRAEDPVGLAEELGMAALTPRLARKVAAAHNPEPRPEPPEPEFEEMERRRSANVVALAFALGGALILLGGSLLRVASTTELDTAAAQTTVGGVRFWLAFVLGGLLMVALAYMISLGSSWARIAALVTVGGVIVLFGYAVSVTDPGATFFAAYGFIAGGIVVGVAVLFSGTVQPTD